MTRKESNQEQTVAEILGPTRTAGWGMIVVILCAAYAVWEGIHLRVEAKAGLHQVAINSAIPSVNVAFRKDNVDRGYGGVYRYLM